jgi:hypothetical protein
VEAWKEQSPGTHSSLKPDTMDGEEISVARPETLTDAQEAEQWKLEILTTAEELVVQPSIVIIKNGKYSANRCFPIPRMPYCYRFDQQALALGSFLSKQEAFWHLAAQPLHFCRSSIYGNHFRH